MTYLKNIPFVFKAAGALIVASFILGQFWLRVPASADEIREAHSAVRACPKVGPAKSKMTKWDVVRVKDQALIAIVVQFLGISESCR